MAAEHEMSTSIGLDDAYSLTSPEDNIRLYRDWAATYESEFMASHGYVYHLRVAERFAELADKGDGPVLDVGCGTGVVGEALSRLGAWAIDGLDISPEMLAEARQKLNQAGEPAYGALVEADLTKPLEIASDTYGSVVSAGTFTTGHVGPTAVGELIRIVRPGGLLVLGVNTRFFAASEFQAHLDGFAADGLVELLETVVGKVYEGDGGTHPDDTTSIVAMRMN